jgi:uncharacterized membrane protein YdjX (TVP38/TMEM64 family)
MPLPREAAAPPGPESLPQGEIGVGSRALIIGGIVLAALVIALTAAWHYTPLAAVVDPKRVAMWADEVGKLWWAPLIVLLAYTPGCWVLFPRPLITLFAVLAFGPWLGFSYSLAGLVIASIATYAVGLRMDRARLERLVSPQVRQVMEILRKRGLLAMTALRMVPLAPFAVEGLVAGAIRIPFWQFTLGSALGTVPGTLAATVFSKELEAAMTRGSDVNWWLLAGMGAALIFGTWLVRVWFKRQTTGKA